MPLIVDSKEARVKLLLFWVEMTLKRRFSVDTLNSRRKAVLAERKAPTNPELMIWEKQGLKWRFWLDTSNWLRDASWFELRRS